MNNCFTLWFDKQNELQKITFQSSLVEKEISSVRGLGSGSKINSTFCWTAAVQSLCLLLLKARLNENYLEADLLGEKGSAAFSLDYALSKQPNWLLEMFGFDSNGNSLLKRLLLIQNPNGKRAVPIEISLKRPFEVKVFLENKLVDNSQGLELIVRELEKNWQPYGQRRISKTKKTNLLKISNKSNHQLVKSLLRTEINRSLRAINIFSKSTLISQAKNLSNSKFFSKISGSKHHLIHDIDLNLSATERVGLGSENLRLKKLFQDQPIKVAIGFSNIGANAIFKHLQTAHHYNFEIDNNFIHALEIGTRIIKQDPLIDHDLCVIANAPAASLLRESKKHDYIPYMFLPFASQRLISPKSKVKNQIGKSEKFLLLSDIPSTALFYYEMLDHVSPLKRTKDELCHREPYECVSELAQSDSNTKAILFFPYYQMNVLFNNCEFVDNQSYAGQSSEVFLFVKKEFASNPLKLRALSIAIRNAWAELLQKEEAMNNFIEQTTADDLFWTRIQRYSGINI